jgi:hypothetical protein
MATRRMVQRRPLRIWLFRDVETGVFIQAVDDPRGGTVYMAAFSVPDALATIEHQQELYDIECEAIGFTLGAQLPDAALRKSESDE